MSALTDALNRLQNFYNDGAYDVVDNPGGFDNNGHRINYINSLRDVATAALGAIASGDIVGPAGATAGAIALFDGITGKLLKAAGVALCLSTTDITEPSGSTYTKASGSLQVSGGLSVVKEAQFGGRIFIGDGTATTGYLGACIINMNGYMGGTGGVCLDMDLSATSLAMRIGNYSLCTNNILGGFDRTPTYMSGMPNGSGIAHRFVRAVEGNVPPIYDNMYLNVDATAQLFGRLSITNGGQSLATALTGTSLQLTQANATVNRFQMDSYGASNFISGVRSNNTKASPAALTLDDEIIGINAYGYGTSVQGPAGHVGIYAYGTWSGTSTPTYIDFSTTIPGSTTPVSRLRITGEGEVVMGMATPAAGVNFGLDMTGPVSGANGGTYIIGSIGFASGNYSWAIGSVSALLSVPYDSTMLFKNTAAAYRFNGMTAGIYTSSANGTLSVTGTTGTGNVALSAGPTFTGTITAAILTASGVISTSNATASTSSTTGSGKFAGGLGVVGDIYGGGAILSTGSASGIGYATGAGGPVTQATSKATNVTINKITGKITTSNSALAGNTGTAFLVLNSTVVATDLVLVQMIGGATTQNAYTITSALITNGQFYVVITNVTGGSLSEALVLRFVVIKSVDA